MASVDYKTTSFTVSGFRDLYRLLDHLPDLAKRKGLEPLLVKSLQPMAELARFLAPDDPLTGPPWDLKSSIIVSTQHRSVKALERISEARAFLGATRFGAPQALMQELGTIKMVATPYLRPAFDNEKDRALQIIKRGFADQVEATLRKYGTR